MELSGDSGEVFACKLRGSLFEIWETDDLFDVFFFPLLSYPGRVELPQNFGSLFRPVAMMVPDYRMIAETIMSSAGFKASRSLSGKLVSLCELAHKQLSQKVEYFKVIV